MAAMGAIPPERNKQMTKIKLMAHRAWYVDVLGRRVNSVLFDFKDHFPSRIVEVDGTAGAIAALDQYEKEAAASGQSLCVSMILMRGERSPNGFKAANHERYVNLQPEPQV